MQVNKYPIHQGSSFLRLPMGAEILKVDIQNSFGSGQIMLWALVRPGAALQERIVSIVATGEPIPGEHVQYINSFGSPGFEVIFHAFEILDGQKGVKPNET